MTKIAHNPVNPVIEALAELWFGSHAQRELPLLDADGFLNQPRYKSQIQAESPEHTQQQQGWKQTKLPLVIPGQLSVIVTAWIKLI